MAPMNPEQSRKLARLNHEQLRMLIPAGELRGMDSIDVKQRPDSRYGGAWKSKEQMWATKHRENRMDGLDKQIAAEGVHQPVTLSYGRDVDGKVIEDGHHRIAAASKANPQMEVPVQYGNLDDRPF